MSNFEQPDVTTNSQEDSLSWKRKAALTLGAGAIAIGAVGAGFAATETLDDAAEWVVDLVVPDDFLEFDGPVFDPMSRPHS